MFFRRLMMQGANTCKKQRTYDYQGAIEALNNLQSNADYLRQVRNVNFTENLAYEYTIVKVQKYLSRIGITLDKLDKLSVIHIAGTKGKGSTCAYCESILRQHGYKTGFFSSPHLVTVRERIRISGVPIEQNVFAKYFWDIYEKLEAQKSDPDDMPLYFRYLTIMAFKIFLEEKVDVAVIEVGIGGEYDCTNVIRKVPVVGITSLGLDHTSVLGNTIESIAKYKSGIMKKDCKAFTVPQPEEAMNVLKNRSIEKQCTLQVVDSFIDSHLKNSHEPEYVFKTNASLAVTLCQAWVESCAKQNFDKTLSYEAVKKGLANCVWLGRYQIIQKNNINFYLDGAHTEESVMLCSKWFMNLTKNSNNKKCLIFNITGDRDSEVLLSILQQCDFNHVYFVPNVASYKYSADSVNHNSPTNQQLLRCEKNKKFWLQMEQNNNINKKSDKVLVLPSVLDAIEDFNSGFKYDCLITGSLHLVGATLSIIDFDLKSKN